MPDQLNVLFICTDQHRGDCISADPQCPTNEDGEPLVHTPNLSHFTEQGALFSRAYSPAPTCVPARRCLWTGQRPANCQAATWITDEWDFQHTLPQELRDGGYQTHLAGKTHSHPWRNHFGFEGLDLHSGLAPVEEAGLDDYAEWLDRKFDGEVTEVSHGLGRNGWDPRPWHLPERAHPTHWTASRAEEFLRKRDPTRPFFLTVSFVRPHQPFDPPRDYWEQYIDRSLPDPAIGDWSSDLHGYAIDEHPSTSAWAADLAPETIHRARAGYYGSITHIDQQVKRVLRRLGKEGVADNTLIVMTADHGEMLGDHHLWRKGFGYEGSARIPLLVRFPQSWNRDSVGTIDRPVGLEDLMPTILDAVELDIPDTVGGQSLLDLCDDPEREDWRDAYHGEHDPPYDDRYACQYLVDEETKYIWNPITGEELLFDVEQDPLEEQNLAARRPDELAEWRSKLATRLEDRPEGFVENGDLQTVDASAWDVWHQERT